LDLRHLWQLTDVSEIKNLRVSNHVILTKIFGQVNFSSRFETQRSENRLVTFGPQVDLIDPTCKSSRPLCS